MMLIGPVRCWPVIRAIRRVSPHRRAHPVHHWRRLPYHRAITWVCAATALAVPVARVITFPPSPPPIVAPSPISPWSASVSRGWSEGGGAWWPASYETGGDTSLTSAFENTPQPGLIQTPQASQLVENGGETLPAMPERSHSVPEPSTLWLVAIGLAIWIALQLPVGMLVGSFLQKRQP
jgi:hypothetical protein